ncbi:MAG: hypothetical protein BJ554DRAFT_2383 [Olpidium bornovanus]|uniref:Uncharacterized protein n=1 Tax=Olpidium bornovanus TaxID=278681 RepID=A0A8H7ZR50_9FUNG|nr:MAG: hypothetical protein BJ554DRAFT_2383 [Olpidium bornovanus]
MPRSVRPSPVSCRTAGRLRAASPSPAPTSSPSLVRGPVRQNLRVPSVRTAARHPCPPSEAAS